MSRLTTLLLNNNLISKISDRIGSYVDNVRFLILTNNKIANLAEIDHIATLQHLEHLSLLENPVTSKLHYRLYIIHRIKSIKTIDYQKVTKTEREQSAAFFQSPAGVAMLGAIAPAEEAGGAAASGQPVPGGAGRKVAMVLTDEQKAFIRAKIEAASTRYISCLLFLQCHFIYVTLLTVTKNRDEIEEIEQQLKSGTIKFA